MTQKKTNETCEYSTNKKKTHSSHSEAFGWTFNGWACMVYNPSISLSFVKNTIQKVFFFVLMCATWLQFIHSASMILILPWMNNPTFITKSDPPFFTRNQGGSGKWSAKLWAIIVLRPSAQFQQISVAKKTTIICSERINKDDCISQVSGIDMSLLIIINPCVFTYLSGLSYQSAAVSLTVRCRSASITCHFLISSCISRICRSPQP